MIPQLLLISGAPGTGKSVLARRLAHRCGACLCTKDEIKELLFDALGTGERAYSRKLSDASFAILFALLPRLLCDGRLLILEGNFRAGEHEPALGRALAGSPVAMAQILCLADPAVSAARLAVRASDPTRHPGHRDAAFDPVAAPPAAPLDLPGPRWEYWSDAAGDRDWPGLCRLLDAWCERGRRHA